MNPKPEQQKLLPPRTRAKTPIGILKAVIRAIRLEPKRYSQRIWGFVDFANHESTAFLKFIPDCGTVCCVAGWACLLTGLSPFKLAEWSHEGSDFRDSKVFRYAMKKLQLTDQQAQRLFTATPHSLYGLTEQTEAYAEAGVAHILSFMRAELGYTGPDL